MTPEPIESHFSCIGCGESVPVGSDLCPGCQHQFREPIPATSPAEWISILDEPSETRARKIPAIRIGTAMILIAAVAICLKAFTEDPTLGVLVSLALLPATFRILYLSAEREAEGRSMSTDDKILCYFSTTGSAILIAASSMAAFGAAYLLMSSWGMNSYLAMGLAFPVACVVGIGITRSLLKYSRAEARRERDWERLHGRRSGR